MNNLENFRKLGISECVLSALQKKGFENPSPIQELTIPLLLKGEKDIVGQAQTGTGKTAAFGIPIIDTITRGDGKPQAVILSPTRELCMQIAEELNSLQGAARLRIAPFYGGQNILIQLDKLSSGVDIVIGTPGRVIDLMERRKLDFSQAKFAVLDEADEMLDMGFVDDIKLILSSTPEDKRMLLFSATMPKEILAIAEQFMRPDYEVIRTKFETETTTLTDQIFYEVRRENKLEALSRIIDMNQDIYGMVFCKTKSDVDELTDNLLARGYSVDALHGDIAQAQRTRVINNFKSRRFNLLIATDVAARGIDINDLTHVVNYSIPQSTEAYVHRIGRTGRAGKRGTAVTFVTPSEVSKLGRIRKDTKADIQKRSMPSVDDVLNAKKQRFAEQMRNLVDTKEHNAYLSYAEELLTLVDHPAEVLAAMLRHQFKNEFLAENYTELDVKSNRNPDRKGNARLKIDAGRNDGITVPELLDIIYEKTRIKSKFLGRIDLKDNCSYINANQEDARRIVEAFRNQQPTVEMVAEDEGSLGFKDEGRGKFSKRDKFTREKQTRRSFRDGFIDNLQKEFKEEDGRGERRHLEPHTSNLKKFRGKSGEFTLRKGKNPGKYNKN